MSTNPDTPDLQSLADGWFEAVLGLKGLGDARVRAEQFMRTWRDTEGGPEIFAVPEHEMWRSAT